MIPLARLQAARALLETTTPLQGDCGRRCGAACCQPDEEGQGGMLLFPGEDALYDELPEGASLTNSMLTLQGRPIWLLTCDGTCARYDRPLACRIFPLTPILREDTLQIVPDVRAWPICPLMPSGTQGLSRAFVAAVDAAMRLIAEDKAGRAFFALLTEQLDAFSSMP